MLGVPLPSCFFTHLRETIYSKDSTVWMFICANVPKVVWQCRVTWIQRYAGRTRAFTLAIRDRPWQPEMSSPSHRPGKHKALYWAGPSLGLVFWSSVQAPPTQPTHKSPSKHFLTTHYGLILILSFCCNKPICGIKMTSAVKDSSSRPTTSLWGPTWEDCPFANSTVAKSNEPHVLVSYIWPTLQKQDAAIIFETPFDHNNNRTSKEIQHLYFAALDTILHFYHRSV